MKKFLIFFSRFFTSKIEVSSVYFTYKCNNRSDTKLCIYMYIYFGICFMIYYEIFSAY